MPYGFRSKNKTARRVLVTSTIVCPRPGRFERGRHGFLDRGAENLPSYRATIPSDLPVSFASASFALNVTTNGLNVRTTRRLRARRSPRPGEVD